MIKKTILITVILFLFYSIYLIKFAPKWWHASQHQWQDNIVKAQNFLFDESDTIQNVIIGSSLSSRLVTSRLPKTYNLSFSGQSIHDGLNILSYKTKIPENVYVEMNVAFRLQNEDFLKSLTPSTLFYVRKRVISLREDKQPIAVLGKIGIAVFFKIKSILELKQQSHVDSKIESKTNNDLFSKMLENQIKDYSEVPNEQIITNIFCDLKNDISKIEKQGCKVIFFEMPVNNNLEELTKAKVIRQSFHKYFPIPKYEYISLPDSFECKTTDGVHLSEEEAIRYTNYFKSKIEMLDKK